jgi:glycosyltransferase involved in cell wall biosynthesis
VKSVLIIAYFFPPVGLVGVQRPLKFAKYLPSFGWRPVVMTPKRPLADYYDHTFLEEIPPEAAVFRTASFDPARWYVSVKARLFGRSRGEGSTEAKASTGRRIAVYLFKPLFQATRWVAYNLVFVPDLHIGWIPFALWRGVWIVKREGIDVILATGSPWSDFLIAYFLSRFTRKPYILDMRDPWTLGPDIAWGGVRSHIENFWERRCILGASKVVNVTEQATQAYREKYKDVDPSKFRSITQGFDPPDFDSLVGNRTERFTIASTATYKDFRNPESLLRAMRSIMDRNAKLEGEIRIRFMGIGSEIVKELVEKYNLASMVDILPYGSHRESIEFILNSDVLLLERVATIEGRDRLATTSAKIFEFLATGKPILGLVYPSGAAAELIWSTNSGVVVDPENTNEVSEAIHGFYLQYKSGTLGVEGQPDLERFTRRHLTGQLAQMLDEAAI